MKKKAKKATSRTTTHDNQPEGSRSSSSSINWPRVGRRPSKNNESIIRLAEQLKSAREVKGLTLAQVARKLDVAPATLIKFEERGHGISVSVVAAIAAAVDCELQVKPVKTSVKKKKR